MQRQQAVYPSERSAEVVAMSYTATFDASHKVKRSGAHAKNFERHIARDADQAARFSFAQRNPNIDTARTSMNITMVNDGNGGWRTPVVTQDADGKGRPPSAELGDYLDSRLVTVKRKLRDDAVVMRPMILQLDPKWFAEHNPDWRENGLNAEAEKYIGAQLDWAAEEFGQENFPGYSVHMDETNPQLQLLFTPVTEDGRLSQKDFFKGPSDLQRQHKAHRQALADAGYDIEFKVTARSREHLSSEEFARTADKLAATLKVAKRDGADTWALKREAKADRDAATAELLDVRETKIPALLQEAFETGFAKGREVGEESVRADLVALDLLPDGDERPILPRRRAPKAATRELAPSRERHLSYSRQKTK